MELNYSGALQELKEIETKLKEGKIDLEELEALIVRANELLQFCQMKLRNTTENLNTLWSPEEHE